VEEIDLRHILQQLWNMVRKHWLLVLALPPLAALAMGLMSTYIITPVYQASTTVIIETKASEAAQDPAIVAAQAILSNSTMQQHVKNYLELAKSTTVQKKVIKALKLTMTPEQLDGAISVSQLKTTDLIIIAVIDKNPATAASIATETAQELSKAVVLDQVKVVDPAEIPVLPIKPNKTLNVVFAFLVGILAACCWIFVREYMDNTLKTTSEVKGFLGIPVLGVIANYEKSQPGKKTSANALTTLRTLEEPNSPIAEAYRSIRTNLEYGSLTSAPHKILITSSGPQEGKSTTVANLAVSLAQAGKSVLVLDADLRNPTQHKLFGLANRQGLSEALLQDGDYRDYLRETTVPGLMVLTGGPIPANPADLLGSQRMQHLIETASEQFDQVLIDAPSVLSVTDAALLARKVDGVVLVLASGQVNKDDAQAAKERLDNVSAKLLGAILNKW